MVLELEMKRAPLQLQCPVSIRVEGEELWTWVSQYLVALVGPNRVSVVEEQQVLAVKVVVPSHLLVAAVQDQVLEEVDYRSVLVEESLVQVAGTNLVEHHMAFQEESHEVPGHLDRLGSLVQSLEGRVDIGRKGVAAQSLVREVDDLAAEDFAAAADALTIECALLASCPTKPFRILNLLQVDVFRRKALEKSA